MSRRIHAYRIGICVPSGDLVHASFAFDLARLTAYTAATRPDIEIKLYVNRGSLLPQLRETLVETALAERCTHVLFIDSDMRFPRDAAIRLLAHDLPVVAINYTTRSEPHRPVAQASIGSGDYIYTSAESHGLERVGTVGFGFMLINADFARKMGAPRFAIGWSKDGRGYAGEDAYFCMRAAQEGFGPVIDHDLSRECGHIGTFVYTLEHANVLEAERRAAAEEAPAPAEPVAAEA